VEAIAPTTNPGYPSSNIVNVNGGYQLNDKVRLRFGIDNLFFKRPRLINVNQDADPAAGELTGGSLNYFDDVQGRRFSVGANIRF
jgi:iron complex outermembrane receptor protein